MAAKARRVAGGIQALSNTVRGAPVQLLRQAVQACVLSVPYYGAEAWWPGASRLVGNKEVYNQTTKLVKQLDLALRVALKGSLPVYKTTPISALHRELGIQPVKPALEQRRAALAARIKRLDIRHPLVRRCAEHQERHEKLGVHIDATRVRLKPGPDDPYRWLVLPSKKHLLEKQLSKSSVRDYDEICSAVDDSALEAVPADEYMRSRAIVTGHKLNRIYTGRWSPWKATRTIHLTAENDMLQIAHQESAEAYDLNGKLQNSLRMMETYKRRAQDSDKAIQTLVEAVDTARSQASPTCLYF
ncbi:hypothetical protein ACJ73_01123 [Blastomyces percursus]|uniref:Uncharacterized protein n=1 Tax=Blastomyces percursus TaxID=1658174 RepID=A0A1J9RHL5_9EURO|nr:hypothetical protein ACJ73_01123 [Blastomyces percursus]